MPFAYQLLDLSHIVDETIPSWEGDCGFKHSILHDYDEGFRILKFEMVAGIGTHMDAPSHCFPDGRCVHDFDVSELIWPAVVLKFQHPLDANYRVTRDDILQHEAQFGDIPTHAMVLVHTGWERFWGDRQAYRNDYHFPSISEDAARYLLDKKVSGVGIDTLSPDVPDSKFVVHHLFLGQGKILLENVANLEHMPERDAYVMAMPFKVRGATEAPIRLVGFYRKD